MSIEISVLIARLTASVAAVGGVPDSDQYEQAVKDAVDTFSRVVPLVKMGILNIVANTATYALPTDFRRLKSLKQPTVSNGTIIASNGAILPVGNAYQERFSVIGTNLVFYPAPTISGERELWYEAGYVLDDNEYTDMTEEVASVALVKARALCLSLQAESVAPKAWKYELPEQKVDKSNQYKAFMELAHLATAEFEKAVAALKGASSQSAAFGMWSQYA